jgi:hypothetical protein
MAATILDSAGASSVSFGLEAESGMLVQSFSRSVSASKAEIMNEDGDIVTVAYYNQTASISLSGALDGFSNDVGAILTISNPASGNGGADGTIVIDSVTESQSADGFRQIEVSATQYEATLS